MQAVLVLRCGWAPWWPCWFRWRTRACRGRTGCARDQHVRRRAVRARAHHAARARAAGPHGTGRGQRPAARVRAEAGELATTGERNRVARDIHDGLGHHLTVVQMQLQAARAVLAADPARADALLDKAQQQSGEALADVRRSVAALREPRSSRRCRTRCAGSRRVVGGGRAHRGGRARVAPELPAERRSRSSGWPRKG